MNIFKLVGSIFLKDEASKPLEDMEEKLGKTESKFKKFGENVNKFGEKASNFGKGMTARVTAPVVAFGGAAIKTATDVSGATRNIQNGLGVTYEEAERLVDIAKDIYKKGFGESLDEVSQALVNVKQNFGDLVNEANLDQVTNDVIVLAEMLDTDINEVTRGTSQLMREFGIDSEKAFDLMAWGAQNGINYSDELLDNVAEYAPLFADAGFSADEYFKLLASGVEEGSYNLDYLNDVVKEFGIRIADGSDKTDEAMSKMSKSTQELFKKFKNGEATAADVMNAVIKDLGEMDDYTANLLGVELFGTKWEDLGADAVLALGEMEGGIEGLEGTMGKITESQEEAFGSRFKSLMRESMDALLPIGEIILDFAQEALPPLIEGVQKAAEWFRDLSPHTQKMVVIFGAIAAAIGPVLIGVGSLISAVSNVVGVFKFIAPAAKAVGVAIGGISWPVVAVIAAIAALIAIGVALWKNWDKVKEVAGNVFGWIKDFIVNAFETVTETISGALDWISENVGGVFGDIAEVVKEYMEMAIENLKLAWDFIKETFGNALDFIKALVTGDFEGMKEAVKNQMENIKEFLSGIWENIKEFFDGKLSEILENLKEKFHEMFISIAEKLGLSEEFIGQAWEYIEGYFKNALDFLKSLVSGDFEGMKEAISNQMENVKQFLSNIWDEIKIQISNKVQEVLGNVRDKFIEIKEKIMTPIREARDKVREFIDNIKGFFTRGSQETSNTVLNKFNEIKNRILTPIEEARDKVKEIVDKIKGFFKNMKLKIPEIGLPKLPKPKVTGGFDLSSFPPKVPKISWNAEGGIFDKPTIFNTDKGLQGVGEAGAEAIMPLDKLRTWIGEWMNVYRSSDGEVANAIDRIGEVIKDTINTPIKAQEEPIENVITINITGDWTVDSDERQRSVSEALANEMERYFRSRGEK